MATITSGWTREHTQNARNGILARHAAVRSLIATNREQYEGLYAGERVSRGLPALPGMYRTPDQVAAMIARQEGRLAKLRGELAAISNGHL